MVTHTKAPILNPNEPQPGDTLAERYALRSILGRGGFGIVYNAQRLDVDRRVALKILLPAAIQLNPRLALRFHREVQLASRLRHPNTVTLYDYGQTEDGILYMAMEYIDGKTLFSVLREEAPIAPERLVKILRQILHSLREAHDQGIIHRDLKPSNIMLSTSLDGEEHVKVLDFGIAKALSPEQLAGFDAGQTITQTGRFCGTPCYMPPEMFRGSAVLPGYDIFAVGLLCYELLTGKRAVHGSIADIILKHVTEPSIVIPSHVSLPLTLRRILNTALEKNPDARYTTADQFLQDLKHWDDTNPTEEVDLSEDLTVTMTSEDLWVQSYETETSQLRLRGDLPGRDTVRVPSPVFKILGVSPREPQTIRSPALTFEAVPDDAEPIGEKAGVEGKISVEATPDDAEPIEEKVEVEEKAGVEDKVDVGEDGGLDNLPHNVD